MAEQDEYAKYREQDWSGHTDEQLRRAEGLAGEYVVDADACGDLASAARWEAVGEGIRLEWRRRRRIAWLTGMLSDGDVR